MYICEFSMGSHKYAERRIRTKVCRVPDSSPRVPRRMLFETSGIISNALNCILCCLQLLLDSWCAIVACIFYGTSKNLAAKPSEPENCTCCLMMMPRMMMMMSMVVVVRTARYYCRGLWPFFVHSSHRWWRHSKSRGPANVRS